MRNKIPVMLGVLAAIFVGALVRESLRDGMDANTDVTSDKVLSKIASRINEDLPMMVDSETELVNVAAGPATVIYNYRLVNLSSGGIDAKKLPDFISDLRNEITAEVCTNPDTRDTFLQKGVELTYAYHLKDGKEIASFDLGWADCLRLKLSRSEVGTSH